MMLNKWKEKKVEVSNRVAKELMDEPYLSLLGQMNFENAPLERAGHKEE